MLLGGTLISTWQCLSLTKATEYDFVKYLVRYNYYMIMQRKKLDFISFQLVPSDESKFLSYDESESIP